MSGDAAGLALALKTVMDEVLSSDAEEGDTPEKVYQRMADRLLESEWAHEYQVTIRGGVSMRLEGRDGFYVCPNCAEVRMAEDDALEGKVCEDCSKGLLEAEAVQAVEAGILRRLADPSTMVSLTPMFSSCVRTWLQECADNVESGTERWPTLQFYPALNALAAQVENLGYRNIEIKNPIDLTTVLVPLRPYYQNAANQVRMGA